MFLGNGEMAIWGYGNLGRWVNTVLKRSQVPHCIGGSQAAAKGVLQGSRVALNAI